MTLPPVFLTLPIAYPLGIFFKDRNRLVCTAAINNNIFKIGIVLQENRPYGLFNKLPLVVRRGNNSDFWPIRVLSV